MSIHIKRKTLIPVSVMLIFGAAFFLFFIRHKSGNTPLMYPKVSVSEEPSHPAVQQYLSFLEPNLDSIHNIGAAVTIVTREKILLLKTYGVKKAGTYDSIDIHTVFRLASVSKGFTGILACILEQEGQFSIQDKVISFLPCFVLKDSVNTYDLKIEHILNHTSGLIPHAYDNLIEDGYPLHLILKDLSEVDISAPPGILYGYQNVVFSLIDTISFIETGTEFDELIVKHIFRPLHMRDASVGPKIFTRKNANVACPHRKNDTLYISVPFNLGYYNVSPAAGINASISDMSKWLQTLLGKNPDILDSNILNKITEPLIVTPLKYRYTRYWDKIESKHYSLGWRIYQYKNRSIIYHGGFVKGYRAEIAFCPEENIGIAFLQNSPNRVASMSIPLFFNIYFNYLNSDSTNEQTADDTIFNGFKLLEDTFDDYNYEQ